MSDVETWTIEMTWSCRHCRQRNPGIKGAEGESLTCSNCGATKADEPWEMPGDVEAVPRLTGAHEALAKAGPNWTCQFCHNESRAGHKNCDKCGARRMVTLLDATRDLDVPTETVDRGPMRSSARPFDHNLPPMTITVAGADQEPRHAPVQVLSRPLETFEDNNNAHVFRSRWSDVDSEFVFKAIMVVGAVLLALGGLYALFTPNTATVSVRAIHWERMRALEVYRVHPGEGWRDDAPSTAYDFVGCESRHKEDVDCHPHDCRCRDTVESCNCRPGRSYDCRCHQECSNSTTSNRNGSATVSRSCDNVCDTCTEPEVCDRCPRHTCDTCYDSCPVYEDWCRYHYRTWDRTWEGRLDGWSHEARWPEVPEGAVAGIAGDPSHVVAEAEYAVRFEDTSSPRSWRRTYPYERFQRFELGDLYRVEWTRAGGFDILRQTRQGSP